MWLYDVQICTSDWRWGIFPLLPTLTVYNNAQLHALGGLFAVIAHLQNYFVLTGKISMKLCHYYYFFRCCCVMWLLLIIDTLMVKDKHVKSYKYSATFLKWFYVCADCVYLWHFTKSRTCTGVCTFPLYTVLLLSILCHTSVSLTCPLLGHTLLHLNQSKLQYIGIESKEHRYFNSI